MERFEPRYVGCKVCGSTYKVYRDDDGSRLCKNCLIGRHKEAFLTEAVAEYGETWAEANYWEVRDIVE